MKKLILFLLFILNCNLFSQQLQYKKDEILKAMRDEINRSLKDLRIEGLEKPYYIAYTVKLRNAVNIRATNGSIVDSNTSKFATLTVDLRVGNYQLDNSNFFDVGLGFFGSTDDEENFKGRVIPYELTYNSLRKELWLATDAAYKQNSEIYSKKLSVMQSRIQKDTIPDFVEVEPQKNYLTHNIPKFNYNKFINLSKTLSSIFNDYPEISSSSVVVEYLPEVTFYVNSEGMEYIKTDYYTGIEAAVFAQAIDGMPIGDSYAIFSKDPDEFPSIDSLSKTFHKLASTFVSVLNAKTLDEPYSGPVLFTEQAAAELIAQIFAPQLVAMRTPMTEGGFQTDSRGGAFQNKIGGRVLPEFLSIKAIPTAKKFEEHSLLGYFEIDDDGLIPKDIDIVNNGYLKTLFNDRSPTRRIKTSNAHKRGGAAMYSTLLLKPDKKKTSDYKSIINRMMKLCKDRELPYGIIVKRINNQNLLFTTMFRTSYGLLQIPRGEKLSIPEAYKIYPDGRMELIRGAELVNISPQSFKDIIMVGKKYYVHNLLAPAVVSSFISGGDSYIGASIITPDLLFEDAEIKSMEGSFPKPPILSNPITKSENK